MPVIKAQKSPPASKPARRAKRAVKRSTLAPDGLPWPEGYFDQAPKQTLEEAIEIYGVRPTHYVFGRPGYTPEEYARPEFKCKMPDEPIELQEKWRKEWEE